MTIHLCPRQKYCSQPLSSAATKPPLKLKNQHLGNTNCLTSLPVQQFFNLQFSKTFLFLFDSFCQPSFLLQFYLAISGNSFSQDPLAFAPTAFSKISNILPQILLQIFQIYRFQINYNYYNYMVDFQPRIPQPFRALSKTAPLIYHRSIPKARKERRMFSALTFIVRASMVAQQANFPPTMPASLMGTSSNPSCSTFDSAP